MIKECVGFMENYLEHYKPTDQNNLSFIVDNIFLSSGDNADQNNPKQKTNRLFIFFPFKTSEIGLSFVSDGVHMVREVEAHNFINSKLIKDYNYTQEEINDLISIINSPEKHIRIVSDNSKRITKEMSSSVIYVFELAKRKDTDNGFRFEKGSNKGSMISGNTLTDFFSLTRYTKETKKLKSEKYYGMKKRLDEFVYDEKTYPELIEFGLNGISLAISNWFYSDTGPRTENISKLDPMCFGIDGNLSIIVVNLLPKDGYSKARESYLKQKVFKNDPINYGTCMCCSKSDVLVEAPEPEVDFNSKKPFFTHPSMMPEGQKPIVICTECALKYAAFFRLMRNWKIKLLPLFVDPILQTKEIRLLNINGLNSFSQVFNQIGDATSLEFYLVLASSGELKYFDYVCNYDWKMDWSSFYKYNTPQKKITKRAFERKVCTAIGLNSLLYFESTKTVNKSVKVTLKKYLRNLLSEKIFNFVYRNKRDLIYSDILQLSVMPIEQLAYSSLNEFNKQINKQIRACLEIWFNHNNLIKVNRGDFVSIEDLRKSEHIDSPEVWAYYAGKSYRFLVFKRASGECLELEVIIRAHSAKNVKDAIIKKLEQRNHALSAEELNQFKLHMNELFAFDKFKGVDFKDLKPYFYAGYIDAIKLERKNGGDSNE